MSYRLAKSLDTLRSQINALFPNRSKISDGWIGNAEHASRESDHNPWLKDSKGTGIVTAIDITLDLDPSDGEGVDCQKLADVLVAHKDSRIKYIIWNRQIISSRHQPWKWRPYSGKNAHKHHLHISVRAEAVFYDGAMKWNLDGLKADKVKHSLSAAAREVDESKATNPAVAFQPATETAGNSPDLAAGANSADTSKATESTQSATFDTPSGQVTSEVSKVNQQNVNTPAPVSEPEPYNKIGFWATIKADFFKLFGVNATVQTVSEYGQQAQGFAQYVPPSLITKLAYLIAAASACYLVFRIVHFALDSWKKAQRVKIEAMANTDISRKNIEWVPNK